MNTITMIPVGLLEHHPENPRKDLGDLTELTASIRKNGIMQNLTVVPDMDNSKYPEECERKAAGDGDLASGMLMEICDRCPLLKL